MNSIKKSFIDSNKVYELFQIINKDLQKDKELYEEFINIVNSGFLPIDESDFSIQNMFLKRSYGYEY